MSRAGCRLDDPVHFAPTATCRALLLQVGRRGIDMRKSLGFFALGLFLVVGSANAGPLVSGQLSVKIDTLPGLSVPITTGFTTAGGAVTATSTNAIVGSDLFVGITNAAPITRLQAVLAGNQTGTLVPGAGTAANSLGLKGVSNVLAYGGNVTLVAVPLTALGIPGATFSFMGGGGTTIKFTGGGWTTGMVTVVEPTVTLKGMTVMTPNDLTATGTNMLVGGVGSITLISPVLIRTNLAGDLPSVVELTLNFAPEPGTLAQFGAAAIGVLGVAAFRRRRSSR
ncbi:MAG: PEP-CTERM sorting domain-containing protein [Myxococcota bacterium]|nr:PEP-CTERM sorting domain-containing protein [Myxococcota bacterium]